MAIKLIHEKHNITFTVYSNISDKNLYVKVHMDIRFTYSKLTFHQCTGVLGMRKDEGKNDQLYKC
jgi:hypothetical protein